MPWIDTYILLSPAQGPTSFEVRWSSDVNAGFRIRFAPVDELNGQQVVNQTQAKIIDVWVTISTLYVWYVAVPLK